jgi:hypothetical protein
LKTDSIVLRDVLGELKGEPSVLAQNRGVSVKDGVLGLAEGGPTAELRTKIDSELKRNMASDAVGISIEANSGKVRLQGRLRSWEEHGPPSELEKDGLA